MVDIFGISNEPMLPVVLKDRHAYDEDVYKTYQ